MNGERVSPRLGKTSDLWVQAALYASLSVIIPGCAVAGYFLGDWLDGALHSGELFAVIGAVVGAAAGITEVLQIVMRWEKRGAGRNSSGGNEPD
ncbi:MAG: AtpZ/AtpI family protein [Terriglobia bacterium]